MHISPTKEIMKTRRLVRGFKLVALSLLTLPVWMGLAADVVVNNFDAASEITQWRFDFGSVTHTESFDPTMDRNGNAASGSMKVTLNFDTSLGGNNKGAYTRDAFSPGVDGSSISASLQFDLKIDSSSAV